MDATLPLVLAVIFAAACTRSAIGFGDALLAMPLLTLLLGIRTATPLVALAGLVMSGVILLGSWRAVDVASAWRLVLASWLGIPLGLWLLRSAPAPLVTGGLGLFLMIFSGYSLAQPKLPEVRRFPWLWLCGGLSGALGAAYNTNGPPIVLYGALRRWPAQRFRATLQGYFLPAYAAVAFSHALSGLWSGELLRLAGLGLLPLLGGLWIGGWLNRRLDGERFGRLLNGLIGLLGLLLLVNAF